ncbi:complement C1q-like protein 3 [Neodiprion virginianus]|uniref:Complement C1q-like protein 3 n=1 Tax=Neodiprion lecontei TaxID=441921 RepID=A0A6J0C6X9_NEOLC|nr:complement C1q-like protein 3 [Neodiprion lecontei]XP_046412278.1 complement C1q-like protein 3 [Neodiprion fabricii]XP_046605703.1 complement C1q-like protein 3 [Neodiprion virginianus]
MWVVWSVLLLQIASLSYAAIPDPPTARTTTVGARKLATAEDCLGVVAFAASHGQINDARVVLSETLVNKGVGYVPATGTFTTHCPGLYQFSFAGYGSSDLRLTLKRKGSRSQSWIPVVSVGPGGGSNLVLLDMEAGDQLAVFVESGKISDGATFTGHRMAKK